MFFLLKRSWPGGLAGLFLLAAPGWLLWWGSGWGPPLLPPGWGLPRLALAGLVAFAAIVCSDGLLHGTCLLTFRRAYAQRYQELAEVFRGQGVGAMVAGAAMAGFGEEVVFRGLGTGPAYLVAAAVVFGLLHHIRGRLWPFTVWACWEGLLLGAAVHFTGALGVAVIAHFLHDLAGFLIFRAARRGWRVAGGG
jgi:membrane protease YdiL (CAAX protease family)